MASVSGGSSSVIKSIQRGTIAQSANAQDDVTITAVDLSKSFITLTQTNAGDDEPKAFLFDTTTLRLDRVNSGGSNNVSWEVIEYV